MFFISGFNSYAEFSLIFPGAIFLKRYYVSRKSYSLCCRFFIAKAFEMLNGYL